MKLTIDKAKELQKEFDLKHEGNEPFYQEISQSNIEELEHLLVCLFGEVGEFSNIVKKARRGDYNLDASKSMLSEELADIFIYMIKISNQLDIDIEKEFLKKLEQNRIRFSNYEKP